MASKKKVDCSGYAGLGENATKVCMRDHYKRKAEKEAKAKQAAQEKIAKEIQAEINQRAAGGARIRKKSKK